MGSMFRNNLKKCCCCIDLRIGCLILCYIELVCCILSLIFSAIPAEQNGHTVHHEKSITSIIVALVVVASCIYGIHKDKHPFMLPHLILTWLAVIGLGAASAILPIMIFFGLVVFKDPGTGMIASALVFWWFPVVIVFVIALYLTKAMHSLYNAIKEDDRNMLPTASGQNVVFQNVVPTAPPPAYE